MPEILELETSRLRLRRWADADKEPFARMGADPRVMEFFPTLLSRAESDATADKCAALILRRGWGLWAVERKDGFPFIGFVGLHVPQAKLPFSPCVEVGWRLAAEHWKQGFATEAARTVLEVAFTKLELREIVAFTAMLNLRSQAVMQRLGMRRSEPFEHPALPAGHILRPHILYRLTRGTWETHLSEGR